MKTKTEPVSFVVGLTFVWLAGGLTFPAVEVTDVSLRWLGAGLLFMLGTVLLRIAKAED